MNREFIVKNRRKMYEIIQSLEKSASLLKDRDYGIISLPANFVGSNYAKFWITFKKTKHPLVRKILIQNQLV